MEVTFLQAISISIWVALVMSRALGGASITLRFTPLMTGLIVGIVFGNISQAMMITAAIQLMYMGVFSPGGQMPSEPAVAASIAVPVALLSNMQPTAAVGIAVPIGLLGSYLYQFRFFLNTFIMQKFTEKYAEQASSSGLTFSIIVLPTICSFVIFVPFIFTVLYFGAPAIAEIIKANEGNIIFHILAVIGGGLASVGIALTVYVIGKRNYVIFFILAYFLAVTMKPLNITMVTYAIIGAIIAFLFVMVKEETLNTVKDNLLSGGSTNSNNNNVDDDDY